MHRDICYRKVCSFIKFAKLTKIKYEANKIAETKHIKQFTYRLHHKKDNVFNCCFNN